MQTIKQWVTFGVIAAATCLGAGVASAGSPPSMGMPQITAARLFRAPSSDAVGAIAGAIVAVNGASWLRRRKGGGRTEKQR